MKSSEPNAFVTVFTAASDEDAQVVRSRLDAAGFHPVMPNEFSSVNLFGGHASAALAIKVQVPEPEAADAKEFLEAPSASAE